MLWVLRLTREYGPVELDIRRNQCESNVRRQFIAGLDQQNIARDQIIGEHGHLNTVSDDLTLIWQHTFDTCHDPTGAPVLPHVEASLDKKYREKDDRQGQISLRRRVTQGLPGNEDKNGRDEQHRAKPLEEVSKDGLDAMCLRRRGCVFAISLEAVLDLFTG